MSVLNNVTFLSNENDTSICNEVQNTIVQGINVHKHVMSASADVAIGVGSTIGFVFSVFLRILCLLRILQGKPRLGGTQGDAP